MARNTRSLALSIISSLVLLLTTVSHAMAGGLTDEQERFLAYLGQSWCMKEKNGLGNDYLDKKVRLYSRMRGDAQGKWIGFAIRLDSLYVAEQIAKAMLRSNCKSVDFKSKHWKNASQTMDRMTAEPSDGTPLPPQAGQEEAWIRKWCSIGWRNYGEVHIDRCIKLIDEHM